MNNNQIKEKDVIKDVALNDLITEGLQIRVSMSEDTIERYADKYRDEPSKMPPIKVFYDSKVGKYYLADGFHRVEAMNRIKGLSIRAVVKEGNKDDAMKDALLANSDNGLQRSVEDIKHAIMVVCEKWDTLYKEEKRTTPDGKPSSRQIARLIGVSPSFSLKLCNILGVLSKSSSNETHKSDGAENLKNDATDVTHDHTEERDPAVRKLLDVGRDRFGVEIPERLVEAFKSVELKELARQLKALRKVFEDHKGDGDPAFSHISTFAISHISSAIRDIGFGKPFCVCRMCHGMGCASCSNYGFMTRSQYSMVPEEFRDSSRVRVCACVN